jgi:hypothetical protein
VYHYFGKTQRDEGLGHTNGHNVSSVIIWYAFSYQKWLISYIRAHSSTDKANGIWELVDLSLWNRNGLNLIQWRQQIKILSQICNNWKWHWHENKRQQIRGVGLGVIGPFGYCWSCLYWFQIIWSQCGSTELTAVGAIIEKHSCNNQSVWVEKSYHIRGEVMPSIMHKRGKQHPFCNA